MIDKTMPVHCRYCGTWSYAPPANRRLWIGTSAVRYLIGVRRRRAERRMLTAGGVR